MDVKIKNLKRHFGKTKAVDDISFEIKSGQIVGFVGHNGAGKTTTMKILATLDEPTDGDAFINDVSITQYPDKVRFDLGFVPDTLPGYADMTSHEYLDFFARSYGLKGKKLKAAVDAVEDFTGMSDFRDKMLNDLSKGMKQRVSLGRALVHDPSFLILDEPAAGLDPRSRIELRELLLILADKNKTIFISSHILTELTEICDSVVIIDNGRIIESGEVNDVVGRTIDKRAVIIRCIEKAEELKDLLVQLPKVNEVRITAGQLVAEIDGDDLACADLLKDLIQRGYRISEFRREKADLEDVFMRVTSGDNK